ncbi:DExH-box ATP-dependent RNA helicase DExH8 [Sesamum angolense]|uniref:RNA helicase n=1 Tax=Sesamum angolense TaxID=2727404 RepID=A0AAE1X925_9LAMI|nr:DExH-box ATP-dependent RNA helicase DExH8 [Sesamum angolense]
MASSPTSSSCSSFAPPFAETSSKFSDLPVVAMRNKIIEKILENRVTLIIGETGCGKSSQIPQFLLEENIEPILCTQPRRFAVVAVARMVARARNCEVGGEVGYHIGHSRVFSASRVLLDEMREKGLNALKYKVIVLDEVHERSVESDLVLVCIKQFLLKKNDLRLVLMSATADISRYREYFKDLGRGERVEVLAIPSTGKNSLFQRKLLYLEQVSELLGLNCEDLSLEYCSGPNPKMAQPDFKPEVHKLIHNLVLHIHNNEPDIEKSLVFLPTYYTLEQQWFLLKPFSESFKVHILHRSLTLNKHTQSYENLEVPSMLARLIVSDAMIFSMVIYDLAASADSAELVWVSKSQAEQRKGRTGRTCDGHVYRLVTGSFYGQLEDYESPAILKLSLRQQVLLICCAESKAINEPRALLQKALDPPDPDVVEDALDLLVHMRALEKASRGRHEPTFSGRLLSSFSLSFDASVLILKFGDIGMLREGILFGILMDLQPLPILRPFGQDNQFMEYTDSYYSGNGNNGLGRKEVLYMGNFSAFQFWQRVFKDGCRLERLENICKFDEMEDKKILLPKIEEEWCSLHELVLPALQQKKDADALAVEDEDLEHDNESRKCVAVPYVGPFDFHTDEVARKFSAIIKEMRIQLTENSSREHNTHASVNGHHTAGGSPLCRYFVNGLCNRGSQCFFSHSLQAKRPVCKFFFSLQGCRNGESCFFSHDSDSLAISSTESSLCFPEEDNKNAESLLEFFPISSHGCVLILDDIDLRFSSNLALQYDPSCIISTTSQTAPFTLDPSLMGTNILWGLGHPYQTIMSREGDNVVPWDTVKCVLWFPRFGNEYGEGQKSLVRTFFNYLAIRLLADALHEVQVILTMNNIRFSQLQVEKLARDSFFFLKQSFLFDDTSFGDLFDEVTAKKSMLVSKPISYVFGLHPPTDFQFGDYATLHQHLHHIY